MRKDTPKLKLNEIYSNSYRFDRSSILFHSFLCCCILQAGNSDVINIVLEEDPEFLS